VWALGFVSLFMDVSSEMIHALLPVFLVSTLGASTTVVGLVEGIAESAGAIVKVFSGAVSDWVGRRKLLAVVGYGLAAATKPVFALAVTPVEVLAARFVDRVGKGIRGAPRDALIADVTPVAVRGAAYGLRQALDTVGAFLGPALAIALLAVLGDTIRGVFAVAIVPAVIAVALLVLGVEEPARDLGAARERPGLTLGDLRSLAPAYWLVVGVGIVLTLARFSEAFLVLRGEDVGIPVAFVPAMLIVMNVVYSAVSTPAGSLSDRLDRRAILAAGLGALIAADLVLGLADGIAGALLGAGLWGLHMGLSQGLLAAMVADTAPERLRGTAFGFFNLAAGGALLAANLAAGLLWALVGAALAGTALAGLLALVRRGR
jgi:MFS family permease